MVLAGTELICFTEAHVILSFGFKRKKKVVGNMFMHKGKQARS